jgi:hypothetical protein
MIRIDHAILATADIEKTTRRLREQYGLGYAKGGVHPDGTRTWIVPFGPKYVQYIEILTVEHPEQARQDPYGRWFLAKIEEVGEAFVGWSLQTDNVAAICDRLGLQPVPGSVTRDDGRYTSWKDAGYEEVATTEWLPFFIEYDDVETRRERARSDVIDAQHTIEPIEIAWIELGGDARVLQDWLGDASLPVRMVDTTPGVRALGLKTAQGEIRIQ